MIIALIAMLASSVSGEILVQEDFEDADLEARGWSDIAKWGEDE